MRLELSNNLDNNYKHQETKSFINELLNYLNNLKNNINDSFKTKEREEGLYYVLNANPNKIYLTKFGDKKVFEATDLPQEIKQGISEGFVLRYKEEKYMIDEELTEKNFEGELNIDNYKE